MRLKLIRLVGSTEGLLSIGVVWNVLEGKGRCQYRERDIEDVSEAWFDISNLLLTQVSHSS